MYWWIKFLRLIDPQDLDKYHWHEGDTKQKNPNDNKKKDIFKSFRAGGPNNIKPPPTKFVKGLIIGTVIITLFFIFGYGQTTAVVIDSCSIANDKITLKNKDGTSYEIESTNQDATAEQLSSSSTNESVYKITVPSNKSTISFNVSKSKSLSATKNHYHFRLDNGNHICSECTDTSSQDCCKGNNNQCCSDKSGTCCDCKLSKLINFAILHPLNPNRITPMGVFFSLLPTILYLAIFLFIFRSTMRAQGMGGHNSIFKIGNSISKEVKSKVTFKDVAGIREEKEELIEIVDFLKNPAKYSSMGARIPRGVILYGAPGTGKTLLAKAVSGEADVPFIEVSGASFDDMFVGVGAKRVRELFAKAKKAAPCIIFIDEIDAVAGKRGNKTMQGGGGIGDQTINQLLSEMDGFNTNLGIIVIAATNQLDFIDPAILRPGRFDRHIQVNLPNIQERIDILKIHSKNKNLSASIQLEDVARKTPGFSGAQLENMLNEAVLLSVRRRRTVIHPSDVDEAIDRVMAGPAKKYKVVSHDEKNQIAHHEAGHAVAGLFVLNGDVVEKITIVPRGKAAGYVLTAPKKQESTIMRKDEMLASITTTLAGRAAEEIYFGEDKISSGASNDLYKVTNLVRDMVTKMGMSKLGLVQYSPSEGITNPYRHDYSGDIAKRIDDEVKRIVNEQYEQAKEIINNNREELDLIVDSLLTLETIDKKTIDFIHKYKKLPPLVVKMKNAKA